MFIAKDWKDYRIIDCSGGEKLEDWGGYRLVRPDPQVIWRTERDHALWGKVNGHYHSATKSQRFSSSFQISPLGPRPYEGGSMMIAS